jgi:hypothetical protein
VTDCGRRSRQAFLALTSKTTARCTASPGEGPQVSTLAAVRSRKYDVEPPRPMPGNAGTRAPKPFAISLESEGTNRTVMAAAPFNRLVGIRLAGAQPRVTGDRDTRTAGSPSVTDRVITSGPDRQHPVSRQLLKEQRPGCPVTGMVASGQERTMRVQEMRESADICHTSWDCSPRG